MLWFQKRKFEFRNSLLRQWATRVPLLGSSENLPVSELVPKTVSVNQPVSCAILLGVRSLEFVEAGQESIHVARQQVVGR
jgi:hypothetical protein